MLMFGKLHLWLASLRDREEGQALVEYALILALIAIVSIAVLKLIGVNVSRVFQGVNNQLDSVPSAP
jgi:pilus assembly protein Flp/PilA